MSRIPNNYIPNRQMNPQPPQPPQPPEPPEPQFRFRWSIFVGIPLVILAFLWLLGNIIPSFQFTDIMDSLDVVNENAYVRLACLGIFLIAITLIVKSLKNHSD